MSWLSSKQQPPPPDGPLQVEVQLGEERPRHYQLGNNVSSSSSSSSSSEPMIPSAEAVTASLFDVGIFRDTLLPSLTLHSSLALGAWAIGRSTNRVEAKDYLWPAGQIVNVWWAAVGRRVVLDGVPFSRAWANLSWPERLILTGVTAWGGRLLQRIVTRSVKREKDDPRYDEVKKQEGFWNTALFRIFLPEALFQTVISLPFTAPFHHQGTVLTGYHPNIQALAVGVFSAGFALEALADYQLSVHQKEGKTGLMKDGVWSIVRHPNYLGDILIHASIPILLYGSDMLAPIELLGPIANYFFLRYYGGDKELEDHQEEKYAKENPVKKEEFDTWKSGDTNSIWPSVQEAQNPWVWIVVGAGVAGVAIEQGLRAWLQ